MIFQENISPCLDTTRIQELDPVNCSRSGTRETVEGVREPVPSKKIGLDIVLRPVLKL